MREIRESSWKECIENNRSIKISIDKAKARSMTDTVEGRLQYLKEQNIKESNVNYIFEGYYACALELLHVVVMLEGYKVSNHICLGFYMRDIIKNKKLFRIFDDCRYKRNSLMYHGRKMDFETAKEAIRKCDELIKELKNLGKINLSK